jgi:hypothetical protein
MNFVAAWTDCSWRITSFLRLKAFAHLEHCNSDGLCRLLICFWTGVIVFDVFTSSVEEIPSESDDGVGSPVEKMLPKSVDSECSDGIECSDGSSSSCAEKGA